MLCWDRLPCQIRYYRCTIGGPTHDKMLISEFLHCLCKSDKSDLSVANSENKQLQPQPITHFLIRLCLISEFGAACIPSYRLINPICTLQSSSIKLGNQHSVTSQSRDSNISLIIKIILM